MMDKNNRKEPNFSLNDFRKWMSKQRKFESRKPKYRGCIVESKISLKRLITKMDIDQGDLQEMAKDFKRRGGTILECDGDNILLVEVRSGTFRIPKFFVNILSSYGES
jgi:hypothetical protein